jgi:hypothetical protein
VRDEQSHRGEGVAGKVFGVGERGFQEGLGDLSKGLTISAIRSVSTKGSCTTSSSYETHLGDILDLPSDAQNSVLYALDDLADPSLDLVLVPDPRDGLSLLTDDDSSLLGTDKSTNGDGSLTVLAGELGEVGGGLVDIVALLGRGGDGRFLVWERWKGVETDDRMSG